MLAVTVVVAIGFLVQSVITSRAFDRLESTQIAQDADRVRIALDGYQQLLRNFGANNSVWDDSFAAVQAADGAALEEALTAMLDRMGAGADSVREAAEHVRQVAESQLAAVDLLVSQLGDVSSEMRRIPTAG